MTRYVGCIATSLHGCIATSDGRVACLGPFNEAAAKRVSHIGYGAFIADLDGLTIGRITYDQVMGWGWPYEDRKGFILPRIRISPVIA